MPIAMPFNMLTRRHWLMLAMLFTLLGCSGAAFAEKVMPGPGGASVWTVYAFGNAQAVSDTFRALANFTASKTFQAIVGLIAMAGVLAVGLSGGFSAAVGRKFIGYFVAVFLITYIFFGVGSGGPVVVKVEVYDTVDGTWKAPVTMPAVVGIPASVISTAGHEITRQIEASFPTPDALKMSNGAPFNLAASLINDASKARITDPNLASSFAYYVQDCFTMGVVRGELVASSLIHSTDFMRDIKVDMPAVYVNTLLSDGLVGVPNVVSCTEAYSLLNAAVAAQGADSASFLNNASAWAGTPALSVLNASADAVAQWSSNNGITNGGSMIKQAAVLSTFNGAYKQAAAATGNSEFLTSLASAQAYETQLSGWIAGAEIFNRVMGYIFAIIQVFVYAITPLVLAATLVPGLGFALLKNFGQILLWLAIWQPMLAIVNFIILSMQQADLGGILNSPSGDYGFTLSSMGIITERTSNMRAAATFIGTMVPALAWALVKGSVDFSRVIGAAGGEKFAATAANTMATGNYSLNQASMDSFTANKHSLGQTGDFGNGMVSTGQGGFMKKHELGGGVNVGSNGASVQATPQASLSGVEQTQLGDSKGVNGTAANAVVGGHTVTHGQSGGQSEQVTVSNASTQNGAVSAQGGAALQIPAGGRPALTPGRQTDSSGTLEAPAGAPGANTVRDQGPGVVGKAMDYIKPNANVALMHTLGDSQQNVHANGANTQRSGSVSDTGSNSDSVTRGATEGRTAAKSESLGLSRGMSVTGIASLSDRVAAAAPAMQYSNFMNRDRQADEGSALRDWASYRKPEDTAMGQLVPQVAPGAIDNYANTHKENYDSARKEFGDEYQKRVATAENRAKANMDAGHNEIDAAQQFIKDNKGAAHVSALDQTADKLKELGKSVYGMLPDEQREQAEAALSKTLDAIRKGREALGGGKSDAPEGEPDKQDQPGVSAPVAMAAPVAAMDPNGAPQAQMPLAPLSAASPAPGQDALANPAMPSPLAAQGADPFNNTTDPRNPEQMQAQLALAEQKNQEMTRRQNEASDSLYTADNLTRNASFESPEEQQEIAARIQDAQNRLA